MNHTLKMDLIFLAISIPMVIFIAVGGTWIVKSYITNIVKEVVKEEIELRRELKRDSQ